ncbi:MAG: bacteriohemerythrin [Rhodospirillaceae bacterium]|nr:bacteriohemerythrin [Rhodospirillaceae bacterium]
MTEFEWKDSYSVGVDELDDQHMVLIDMINYLHKVESEGGDLTEVMKSLSWYVRDHFALEETMMKNAGYPDMEEHIAGHREFEKWFKSVQSDMETGKSDTKIIAKSIGEHLIDWLKHHITEDDMDYKGKI